MCNVLRQSDAAVRHGRADPNKFASAVRDEMAKELAIPCTSHTHEDMFLAMTATSAASIPVRRRWRG